MPKPSLLTHVRIDKLEITPENLRDRSWPGEDLKLKESLALHGVIVPLIVRKQDNGKYAVIDGGRRVRLLRELDRPGKTPIPVLMFAGDDLNAVTTQLSVNQLRSRLSPLAEAEGVRLLVQKHGMTATAAAHTLGRTRSWASKILSIFELPDNILKDLRNGEFHAAHAIVMAKYRDRPQILNLLHKAAVRDNISKRHLAIVARRAERQGPRKAARARPRRVNLGGVSWVRIKPLIKGIRAELHLSPRDDPQEAVAALGKLLRRVDI